MKREVLATIRKYNMISPGDTVVVGLSGGSDSMALITVLIEIRNDLDFDLKAAHVNHCLRGKDADSDEKFVTAWCKSKGIDISVLKADVSAIAKEMSCGLEEAGRKVRYDFFGSFGPDVRIATAHNLSDRCETMLFNIARGSSLKGLGSIPPVRGNIIRPLINCSKGDILAFCAENNVPFVTDKTNFDTDYTRNRIRLNIIPELKIVNSAFEKNARGCLEDILSDEAYLSDTAKSKLNESTIENGYDIKKLVNLPMPIKRRCVEAAVSEKTGEKANRKILFDLIDAIDSYSSQGGRLIQLSNSRFARTRAGILEFLQYICDSEADDICKASDSECDFELIKPEIGCVKKNETNNLQFTSVTYFCDSDKIKGNPVIRNIQPGDCIKIAGRGVTKQVRRLFNEMGVAPEERKKRYIIADDLGPIIVQGCGVAERVKADKTTFTYFTVKELRG
ncbi:MAG: tRNA lysidine(34) synthetase TilS [Clostridiales bacterium]|nr:tRNA lysidine(34) synthetase TilS [Clostridiales bacterium]